MGTVTIAATYGAGGSVVAPAVAKRLRLHLIDRAIPVELAKKLAHEGELPSDELQDTGRFGRYMSRAVSLTGLYVGVPVPLEAQGADNRIAQTEEALRRVADGDGAVVLGRAGVFVLRGRADVLHVRLDASPEARKRQAMVHEHLDEETAERMLREIDRARNAYIRTFYPGERWEDPINYHLVLDSTAIPLDTCTEIIVIAAQARFAQAARIAADASA